jgi:hypothetical protein
MSEPLSSHEIEDVLSSIRRLVSEDLRPGPRATGSVAPLAPVVAPAGKLVLTQALRVVPGDRGPAAVATAGAGAVAAEAPDATAQPAMPFDEIYDDIGVDDGDCGLKAILETVGPAERVAPAAEPMLADEDDVVWASAGEVDVPESEDDPEPGAPPAAEGFRRGHWTAESVPQVDWMQADEDWLEDEPVPFSAHPRAGAAAGLTGDPLARAWADRAEAEVHAKLEEDAGVVPPADGPRSAATAKAADTPPGPGLFDGEESMIDEEMLRDIVREIIREELAGTLGERITRNVRKLVRVEINRALTAREFE